MKFKILIIILCLIITFSVTVSAKEELLVEDAKAAVLIEPETMQVLYSKAPYEKLEPASLTKIMTMILVCEAIDENILALDQMLTTSEYAQSMGGTNIYLEAGEKMSVEDLLKSVAIASANDAAVVLAEGISGSVSNFVKKMNDKAKELKLTNTSFKNPNGLPESDHYTCAMDMAIMSAHLINEYKDIIIPYTSRYEDYVREDTTKRFWLVNRNKLVKFLDGVDGLKTGWTQNAGYCISATINKNNMRFIAVVMKCSTPSNRLKEATQMLNYAVNNYQTVELYKAQDIIKTYENINFVPKKYHLVVKENIYIIKKKSDTLTNITVEENINYSNILENPGTIKVFINGKLYNEYELEVLEYLKKASFFDILKEVLLEIFLVS